MVGEGQSLDLIRRSDAPIKTTRVLCRLRGVLCDIACNCSIGAVSFTARPDGPNVELRSPGDRAPPAFWPDQNRRSHHRLGNDLREQFARRPCRWCSALWIGAVQAEDDVEMHEATTLELGNLGEANPSG